VRTFEEALATVCQTVPGDAEAERRVLDLQREFRPDIFGNEVLRHLGHSFVKAMDENPDDDIEEGEISTGMLVQFFLNAVCLGVTIGVQMERAELEPSPQAAPKPGLWRRVRALLAK
jgi:hypothetical protein